MDYRLYCHFCSISKAKCTFLRADVQEAHWNFAAYAASSMTSSGCLWDFFHSNVVVSGQRKTDIAEQYG